MGTIDQHQEEEPISSTEGQGETFLAIAERRLSRRAFLKGAVTASAVVVGATMAGETTVASAQEGKFALSFKSIEPSAGPDPLLAEGHSEQVLIAWGDPVVPGAPALDVNKQTAAAQEQQFGYNCDYV